MNAGAKNSGRVAGTIGDERGTCTKTTTTITKTTTRCQLNQLGN
jgi:hypothetical protein